MSTKSARLEARLSPKHQSVIQQAASLRGQSVTDFVVSASLAEAQRIIAENAVIEISLADQERFAAALLKKKPLTKALRKAAAAHSKLIERKR